MLSEVAGTCISLNFMCHALHDLRPECAGSSGYEKSLSVGSWPKIAAHQGFMSVCFGEIDWLFGGKFLNFGFSCIHQQ